MPERSRRRPASLLLYAGNRRVLGLLILGALLLIVAFSTAFLASSEVAETSERVEHTLEVEAAVNRLAALNERFETARRGYLLSPNAAFQQTMRQTNEDIERQIADLEYLVTDNPRQAQRIERIAAFNARRGQILSDTILTPATIASQARENFTNDPGVVVTRQIRDLTTAMVDEEANLLVGRNRTQAQSLRRFYTVGGIASILLIVVLGAVIVIVLRYNRELTQAQAKLRRANEGLEEAVTARTAELLRANQEIQRFAYIVSHDLRSPLVNVLGFTAELDEARKTVRKFMEDLFAQQPELRDEQAWLAVEEDLPEALGFIRASTEKMDRLINSILQLSRQGRRQLSPEALDMDALADGVVATLHQRTQDAGAVVEIAKPLPTIESDRIAVEQILANLVENAIKYLSPARPGEIAISGSEALGIVRIDVTDNGRGIDPKDHERIFELFRRSGAQDQPGEGIGLANVRALAYRLGGTIEVESQLDQGARFRLSLPAKFIAMEVAS